MIYYTVSIYNKDDREAIGHVRFSSADKMNFDYLLQSYGEGYTVEVKEITEIIARKYVDGKMVLDLL